MAEQYIVTYDTHGLSLEGRKFTHKQIMGALAEGIFRPGMRFRRGRAESVFGQRGQANVVVRGRLRRSLFERGNDEGRAALRALALHAHVRFFSFEQVPLRAQELKSHIPQIPNARRVGGTSPS